MIRKLALASQNNIQDKSTMLAATKESDEDKRFAAEGFSPPNNYGIDLVPIRLPTNPQFTDGDRQAAQDHFQMCIRHQKRTGGEPAKHYFNGFRDNPNRKEPTSNLTNGAATQANVDVLREIYFAPCVAQPFW